MTKMLSLMLVFTLNLIFGSMVFGQSEERAAAPGASVPGGEMTREDLKAEKKEMKRMKRVKKEEMKAKAEKEQKAGK